MVCEKQKSTAWEGKVYAEVYYAITWRHLCMFPYNALLSNSKT